MAKTLRQTVVGGEYALTSEVVCEALRGWTRRLCPLLSPAHRLSGGNALNVSFPDRSCHLLFRGSTGLQKLRARLWDLNVDYPGPRFQSVLTKSVQTVDSFGPALTCSSTESLVHIQRKMRLSCGHKVRRQYSRLEAAAAGVHALGCDECREARYAKEAHKHDWLLVGPAKSGRAGYRSYDHHCGHRQDIMIGNMLWGDCVCAGCGKGWSAKKSFIYLFQIPLPGLPVLKLGYSARPEKRLRHQLGIDPAIKTEVLRVIELPKGNRAISEERTCHRHMNTWHPELVVPKAEFGDRINTQGEIYRFEAADTLNVLMDGIALRYRQT